MPLNPPPDSVFGPGDQVIAISEDDDTVTFSGFVNVAAPVPALPEALAGHAARVLIVGWRNFGPKMVEELHEFLGPGSQIEVWVDAALIDASAADEIHRAARRAEVRNVAGGREQLLTLTAEEPFDQVIVLGYRAGLSVSEADSRTLLTLLTLRKIWPATSRVRIIAQLLDQANVQLASTTDVDDFIVSDALASLMLAQLSERAELQGVFDCLFDPEAAVVELRPAHLFTSDVPIPYSQVVAAGVSRSVSVIGRRITATREVVINPPKRQGKRTPLVQWGARRMDVVAAVLGAGAFVLGLVTADVGWWIALLLGGSGTQVAMAATAVRRGVVLTAHRLLVVIGLLAMAAS